MQVKMECEYTFIEVFNLKGVLGIFSKLGTMLLRKSLWISVLKLATA